MFHRDIMNQFHQDDRLSHASAAKKADLAAARVGGQEVYYLDPGFKSLHFGLLIDKLRGRAMDGKAFLCLNRPPLVHRLADDVDDASQGLRSHRYRDTSPAIHHLHPPDQPFGAVHGDAADRALAQMLRDLHDEIPLLLADRRVGNLERIVDGWQRAIGKLDIHHCPQDLRDFSQIHTF